jgi:hypothetical protein
MSRTLLGTPQEPLARADDGTPDSDERSRKKVRWNSDSLVEGDKQAYSEGSNYDHKVGPFHPLTLKWPLSLDTPRAAMCSQICLAAMYSA